MLFSPMNKYVNVLFICHKRKFEFEKSLKSVSHKSNVKKGVWDGVSPLYRLGLVWSTREILHILFSSSLYIINEGIEIELLNKLWDFYIEKTFCIIILNVFVV